MATAATANPRAYGATSVSAPTTDQQTNVARSRPDEGRRGLEPLFLTKHADCPTEQGVVERPAIEIRRVTSPHERPVDLFGPSQKEADGNSIEIENPRRVVSTATRRRSPKRRSRLLRSTSSRIRSGHGEGHGTLTARTRAPSCSGNRSEWGPPSV